ncbi:MAG: HK97 family phage prohead protease [Rhizobiaceae bacterium]
MTSETMPRLDERKFIDLRLDEVAPDGTFTGYASLFGVVDLAKDAVERGAFARSLKARGAAGIRMLYQHDPNEPIGTWTEISEDGKGLFVRGKLAAGVKRAREVLDLMRHGALDGLSIGFRASRARSDPRTGIRHILEADLWEISIVTFPMLPGARVERVKTWRPGNDGERLAQLKLAGAIRRATRMINAHKTINERKR